MIDSAPTEASSRRARSGLAVLACLLALIALLLAGWSAWQQRWLWRSSIDNSSRTVSLEERVISAERDANTARVQQQNAQRQIDDMQNDLRAARDAQNALDQRTRNLESALGRVSDQQFQSRDALLLDDAEFLLRAGEQRYALFRDADAAARAYALADDALAQVSDPAFAPVRSALANERATLAAAASPLRQQALDELAALRAQAASLPLSGSEEPKVSDNGVLARAWRALRSVLSIERDNGVSAPAADARLAREMLMLDLAQAQASLLAFDEADFRTAVQHADALLVARFDSAAPEVRAAHAQLQALLSSHMSSSAPQLGGALAQLRALRAAHAVQSIVPAPAVTTIKP